MILSEWEAKMKQKGFRLVYTTYVVYAYGSNNNIEDTYRFKKGHYF